MEAPVKVVQIGKSLKQERERRFITQIRLSESSGITQKQISLIERNEVEPRFSTVLKLAEALGVDPSELVDD